MKQILLPALIVVALTGCGGGGGGSTSTGGTGSAPTPTPVIGTFSASFSALPSDLAETTSTPIQVTVSNVKTKANITFSSSDPAVTITAVSDNAYTLTAADVDREVRTTITMVAVDGTDSTRTVTKTANVTINNTSFAEALSQIETLLANRDRIVNASSETTMLKSLNDVSGLVNSQQVNAITNADPTFVENALNSISIELYRSGDIGDTTLIEQLAEAKRLVDQHLEPHKKAINTLLSALAPTLPSLVQADRLVIDPTLNTVSYFIGEPTLGKVVNKSWVFNTNVEYLAGLADAGCNL